MVFSRYLLSSLSGRSRGMCGAAPCGGIGADRRATASGLNSAATSLVSFCRWKPKRACASSTGVSWGAQITLAGLGNHPCLRGQAGWVTSSRPGQAPSGNSNYPVVPSVLNQL